jgi:A/G-specific adenine glycosylase
MASAIVDENMFVKADSGSCSIQEQQSPRRAVSLTRNTARFFCYTPPMTIPDFRRTVWQYYNQHKRDLPWRRTHDSYAIVVSEIMLQQTQVDRVIPKYDAWVKRWPDFKSLARTRVPAVLQEWQGLGYNRRALSLHRLAQVVAKEQGGKLPRDEASLVKLPGIGSYTAAAICAFAYNQPVIMIETNIRSVFIHHYFPDTQRPVTDAELLPLIANALDKKHPRDWYWALMDYGSHLKKQGTNPARRSRHYVKQSRFAGSNRQVRGGILKALTKHRRLSKRQLVKELAFEAERIETSLQQLQTEGFITVEGGKIQLG